jgi:superfamily II DNA or RNA helicase
VANQLIPGSWAWLPGEGPVQILDSQDVYGAASASVHSVTLGVVSTISREVLRPIADRTWTDLDVAARLTGTRVAALAVAGIPVHSRHAGFQLLPHQEGILRRAMKLNPVRLAICCEVGLGKTMTAGAIVAELLARNSIRRILVLAPKGVQLQWVAEMRDKFGIDFARIGPEGVPISSPDIWAGFDLVVTSTDAVKPMYRRAGWTAEQVRGHNDSRFNGLVKAGWDVVIIDEAHHVAGSTDDVSRHRLARALTASATNVLLLTATPHSGKSESFRRFLGLIDDDFNHGRPVTAVNVRDIIARTAKRTAVDNAGNLLFRPRTTRMEVIPWGDRNAHRRLYDDVTEWVRDGYVAANASGNNTTGFLLLLFQRLVASSTPALLVTLQRRRAALIAAVATVAPEQDLLDLLEAEGDLPEEVAERFPGLPGELAAIDAIIAAGERAISTGPDPKVAHFLGLLRALQRAEHNPTVKVLVFTQFRATQAMLLNLLGDQGITCTGIDGSMGLEDRRLAQERFSLDAQVLVSTDAGGEGVNLQFAHVVVNWDLPWSPTLIEQRIGRVDRIGQAKPVLAVNLAMQDSVDQRVIEVLEEKLARILDELGVDKRNDVLATADGLVDSLYLAAILNPDTIEAAGDEFAIKARTALSENLDEFAILDSVAVQAPPLETSPMPALLEILDAMDVARIRSWPTPWMVPGEPAPVVTWRVPHGGWLVVGVVGCATESGMASNYFAVFLRDEGRSDPTMGEQLWANLAMAPPSVSGSIPVPDHVGEAISAALADHSYRPLLDISRGAQLRSVVVRPSIVVRIDSEGAS